MISAPPTLRHRTQSQSNINSRAGHQCDGDDEWLDGVVIAVMIDGKTMRGGFVCAAAAAISISPMISTEVLFVANLLLVEC